jgi:hypothetical protein
MSVDFWILPHVVFGVWGIFVTLWLIAEIVNISENNLSRIKTASWVQSALIWLAFLFGGWWYYAYYNADKAIILKGPFPQGQEFFMETKEHIFFSLLLLSMFIPIIVYQNDLLTNKSARRLVVVSAFMLIVLGFVMEGSGSLIALAVKMGLGGK